MIETATSRRLAAYLDAERCILDGQRVRFGDDELVHADLDAVRREITRLQRQLAAERRLQAGGPRARVALADFSESVR